MLRERAWNQVQLPTAGLKLHVWINRIVQTQTENVSVYFITQSIWKQLQLNCVSCHRSTCRARNTTNCCIVLYEVQLSAQLPSNALRHLKSC